jgi:hypothetical protein
MAVGCGKSYDPENPTAEDIPVLLDAAKEALIAQYDLKSGVDGVDALRRWHALDQAVEKVGQPAVPRLLEILADRGKHRMSRSLAAQSLGKMGKVAAEAVPALIEASKENDRMLSESAAKAAWKIDPDAAAKVRLPKPPRSP